MNSVLACALPADLQVNLITGFLLLVLTHKPERMHLDSGQTVSTGLAGRQTRCLQYVKDTVKQYKAIVKGKPLLNFQNSYQGVIFGERDYLWLTVIMRLGLKNTGT